MGAPRPVLGENGIIPDTPAARDAARLRKQFRSFEWDLAAEVEALKKRSCLPPDTPIPGTGGRAFKRRVKRSDSNEGKRGGYRFVYGIFPEGIAFLRLYYKPETADVPLNDLLRALVKVQQYLSEPTSEGTEEPDKQAAHVEPDGDALAETTPGGPSTKPGRGLTIVKP